MHLKQDIICILFTFLILIVITILALISVILETFIGDMYWGMLASRACEPTVISTAKYKCSKTKARQHLLWSRKQNICARIAVDLRVFHMLFPRASKLGCFKLKQ